MKKIVIHSGFHPDIHREYEGEQIFKVLAKRSNIEGRDFHTGTLLNSNAHFLKLENGAWIKDCGDEKYETDWTSEERWGRVEELELDDSGNKMSSTELGYMILRVDRSRGLL